MEICYWTAEGFREYVAYWSRPDDVIDADPAESPSAMRVESLDEVGMLSAREGEQVEFGEFGRLGQIYRIASVMRRPAACEVHIVIEPVSYS